MATFLSAVEASRYTGLSERTIRRMLADGRIRNALKLPSRAWAIPLSSLARNPLYSYGLDYGLNGDYRPYIQESSKTHPSAFGGILEKEDAGHIPIAAPPVARARAVNKRTVDDMLSSKSGRGKFFKAHGMSYEYARKEWLDCPLESLMAIRYAKDRHKVSSRNLHVCEPMLAGCKCRHILV